MWSPWMLTLLVASLILSSIEVVVAKDIDTTCEATNKPSNSAFVFVKPHANTPATRELVMGKLTKAGITVHSESDIDGTEIDERGLIDQHYYSIASKATILPAKKIPVPGEKFQETFGESWGLVLKENRACNAMEACKRFDCSPLELNDVWQKAEAVKFGGGFYCGKQSFHYLYCLFRVDKTLLLNTFFYIFLF